jgi:hypothetical protein
MRWEGTCSIHGKDEKFVKKNLIGKFERQRLLGRPRFRYILGG